MNRERGELIGNLGADYIVEPLERWVSTPMFLEAYKQAVAAMKAAGALLPIRFEPDDVLVQAYPKQWRVAFLFVKRVRFVPHYHPVVISLSEDLMKQLKQQGVWVHDVVPRESLS